MIFRNYEDITSVVSKYLHFKKSEECLVHLKQMSKFIKLCIESKNFSIYNFLVF